MNLKNVSFFKSHKRKILVISFIVIATIILHHQWNSLYTLSIQYYQRNNNSHVITVKPLKILTWNHRATWYGNRPWWKPGLISARTYPHCQLKPEETCIYTHDRSEYISSDVVVFNFMMYDHPVKDIPSFRSSKQKWIFYQNEPVQNANVHVKRAFNNLFNITATYKSDSDIYIPYGTRCKASAAGKANLVETMNDEIQIEQVYNIIKKKTRQAAWIVSNCVDPSSRQDYVKELQRYMTVDIYGECGNLTCEKDGGFCKQLLIDKYKFYLSFESCLCQDYVTEKFFRFRNLDIVAVVRGLADYTRFAPPGTYIDVRDFSSAKKLAEYLKLLDSRPNLYAKYLLRKRARKACKVENLGGPVLCRMCKYIHANAHREQRVVLGEFWNATNQCKTAKEFQVSSTKFHKVQKARIIDES